MGEKMFTLPNRHIIADGHVTPNLRRRDVAEAAYVSIASYRALPINTTAGLDFDAFPLDRCR